MKFEKMKKKKWGPKFSVIRLVRKGSVEFLKFGWSEISEKWGDGTIGALSKEFPQNVVPHIWESPWLHKFQMVSWLKDLLLHILTNFQGKVWSRADLLWWSGVGQTFSLTVMGIFFYAEYLLPLYFKEDYLENIRETSKVSAGFKIQFICHQTSFIL